MKIIVVWLILTALLLGNACAGMTFLVIDKATKAPLKDVVIEMYRPFTGFERLTNPVGAFYHSTILSETRATNEKGVATFTQGTDHDEYRILPKDSRSILVKLTDHVNVEFSPPEDTGFNKKRENNWIYSLWFEGQVLKHSASLQP